jgi:hypothetical protein
MWVERRMTHPKELSRSGLLKGEKARLQEFLLHSTPPVLHPYSTLLHSYSTSIPLEKEYQWSTTGVSLE